MVRASECDEPIRVFVEAMLPFWRSYSADPTTANPICREYRPRADPWSEARNRPSRSGSRTDPRYRPSGALSEDRVTWCRRPGYRSAWTRTKKAVVS